MFDNSSDATRRIFVRMQGEAREMGHAQLGTEHLLIALGIKDAGSGPGSIALQTLYQHDLNPITLRVRVENITGRGMNTSPSYLPITLRLRRVVELAHHEREQFGSVILEPEHLLLGLLRESEQSELPGIATIVLRQELGTSDIVPQLRSTVTWLLAMKRMLNGSSSGHIVNQHELELWEALKSNLSGLSAAELEQARDRAVEAIQELAKASELLNTLLPMLQWQRASRIGNG